MSIIEALEKFFSIILGLFIGIAIGIWFLVRAVLRLIIGILRGLICLLIPPLRYKLRLRWMLRDAVHGDKARLHTGIFSTEELKGAETDTVFLRMRQCMDTYRSQKRRRHGKKSVYDETDRLYPEFVKQFTLAAETVDFSRIRLYDPQVHPAFATMRKAVAGTEELLARQEEALPPEVLQQQS